MMEIIREISIKTFQIVLHKHPDSLFSQGNNQHLCYVYRIFNLPIGLILGGFHMKECTSEQYVDITDNLRSLCQKSVGVCHCTGIDKYADMHHECEAHVFYNYTGNMVEFPMK